MKFKKTLLVCAAWLSCLSMLFLAFPISAAAGGAASEYEYYHKETFTSLTALPDPQDIAGFRPLDSYSQKTEVKDGVLHLNYYKEEGKTAQAFADLQLWSAPFGAIADSFTLTMNLQPTQTWDSAGGLNFLNFRFRNGGVNTEYHKYFSNSQGKLVMHTDSGTAESKVLPTDSFTMLEFVFHFNGSVFNRLECYVDGVKLGERALSDATLTAIDHFRMFTNHGSFGTILMDSFALVKGTKIHYGTPIPGDTVVEPTEPIPSVPTLPTVSDSEKSYRKYFFHQDFSGSVYAANSPSNTEVVKADGFWLNEADSGTAWELKDGALEISGAEFLDLQLYQDRDYRVREDFVLSFWFKPLVDNASSSHLITWRRNSDMADQWDTGRVYLRQGQIFLDDIGGGKLPVGEWTLIELAFHHNADLGEHGEFDEFSLLVNGAKVATVAVNSGIYPVYIEHFRMFRYMNSYPFAIDELNIISGDQSILYALPYGTEPPAESPSDQPSENPSDDPSDEPSENPSEDETESKAPTGNDTPVNPVTQEQSTAAESAEQKNIVLFGCGSALTGGGSAMLGLVRDGEFMELSFPSTSSGSCAGQVRPISTLFYIPIA